MPSALTREIWFARPPVPQLSAGACHFIERWRAGPLNPSWDGKRMEGWDYGARDADAEVVANCRSGCAVRSSSSSSSFSSSSWRLAFCACSPPRTPNDVGSERLHRAEPKIQPQARLGKIRASGMVDCSGPALTDSDWRRWFIPAEVAELRSATVVSRVVRLSAQPYEAPTFTCGFGEHPRRSKAEPNTCTASAIGESHGRWPIFQVISPCLSLLESSPAGSRPSVSTSAREEPAKRGNCDSETN